MRSETGFALDVAQAGQLLVLRGRLDVRVTADVRLALAAAVSDGSGQLVVDVAALEGVDATGMGVLLGAHRRAGRVGRTLVLRDVPPALARVLFLTKLDRVLCITPTVVLA
ncbi:MAG: STAS domain-containing protein [Actinomycetota bacterium]|nr:STAS domain-containing protein [Actinomycetota bacterium]